LDNNIADGNDFEFTGLRPGEKLYEELLLAEEGVQSTKNDKNFVAQPSISARKIIVEVKKAGYN